METLVQKYLLTHSLDDLRREHAVRYTIEEDRFSLNYHMLEAKKDNPIACECRGMVLRPKFPFSTDKPIGPTELLAYPFNRFFNHGEEHAANLDWDSVKYELKMDGTCAIVYFDGTKWCIGTRNNPVGSNKLFGFITFSYLAEAACFSVSGHKDLNEYMQKADTKYTYIFELTGPDNQVIVEYLSKGLCLIGVRNNKTLHEENPDDFIDRFDGATRPELFSDSIEDIVSLVNSWDARQREGIVAVDSNWNRVKIKNPDHSFFNSAIDRLGTSPRNIIDAILRGKYDDVYPFMPPVIQERMRKLDESVPKLFDSVRAEYEEIVSSLSDKSDRKAFAMIAKKSKNQSFLFPLFMGRSIDEQIEDQYDRGMGTTMCKRVYEACCHMDPALKTLDQAVLIEL